MKKIVSLLLCAVMLTCALAACSGETGNGPVIPVYISSQISSFDPALSLNDEAALKVIGMIYEGLTRINSKGKVENAMLDSWTYKADEENELYTLEMTLKHTQWSDARDVTADDYVYAWKRIMEPEFQCEAAALLMDLSNADKVKSGDVSIDDLGVYSADTDVLQVTFSRDIDPELFLEYCASPALYPLREDIVKKAVDWSSNTTILVTNGPFTVRSFHPYVDLIIERNIYYYRNVEKDRINKYVTAYRFISDMTLRPEKQLAAYEDGEILYINELPLDKRADYKDEAVVQDTFNTHTYFFNTTRAPFDNADVRRGLSLAIDREEVARIVTFAKAAEGFVPEGIAKVGKSDFRETSGKLLDFNMDEAKSLTSRASEKSFSILIRDNETDRAVAEYCQSQWEKLGFRVSIKTLGLDDYEYNEYDLFRDEFNEAYMAGDFDVIAIDWQSLSTDAWSTLAPFSKDYSGSAINLVEAAESGSFENQPHITGYSSAAYEEIIDRAFAELDRTKRAEILVEAEKLLAEDMPVMPLFVYQDYYLMSSELSYKGSVKTFWGYRMFNKVDYKNYAEETAG